MRNKTARRQVQAATCVMNLMLKAASSANVHLHCVHVPGPLREVIVSLAMMRAAAAARRLPVTAFRCDKPLLDVRRAKRWARKNTLSR
jgi:hypothetical protein